MQKKNLIAVTAALLIGFAGIVRAQDEVVVNSVPLGEGLHMLTGKGGNIVVMIGADGTFMIDDQFAPLTEKIINKLTTLGGSHPGMLINTHYHLDHTGGNENIGTADTVIYSHHNVRRRLTMENVIKEFNMVMPPQSQVALPVVTFSDNITFHLNGDTVHAFHVANAHTDGDAVIHFRNANVIHAGDTFFNGFFPYIDTDHGGTVGGVIAAANAILALADGDTKIVPGHGPLGNQQQLREYRDMLVIVQQRLGSLKASGRSVDEVMAMKPLVDLQAKWGNVIFTSDSWIPTIFDGI